MTDPKLIARAYAHMDEANEAHSRGEETADEKRLRDARDGNDRSPDEGSCVTLRTEGDSEEPKPKRTYRPKPSAAAQAWLERRAQEQGRKSLEIALPVEATEIWNSVQHSQGGGRILPASVGQRSVASSASIKTQIWTWVRSTPGFAAWVKGWKTDEEFHVEVGKWLPRTFYEPLPTLTPADQDEQRRGRREIEDALKAAEGERLLPGMVRSDGS